jgi:hypothetical protein
MTCPSSFLHPSDCPYFRCTDWANFQAHLESGIPSSPEMHDEVAINMCDKILSSPVLEAVAATAPETSTFTWCMSAPLALWLGWIHSTVM